MTDRMTDIRDPRSVRHESAAPAISLDEIANRTGLNKSQLKHIIDVANGIGKPKEYPCDDFDSDDEVVEQGSTKLLKVEDWLSTIRGQLKSLTEALKKSYSGEMKYITFFISNIESVALYLLELASANSRSSISFATLRFIKMIKDPNKSLTLDFTDFIVNRILQIWNIANIKVQGHSNTTKMCLNGLDAVFSGLRNVKHHTLLQRLTRLTHFLATYLTFHMFGVEPEEHQNRFNSVLKFMQVKKLPTVFDFFDEFLETANDIISRFKTFMSTGSLSSLFENTDEFGTWLVACDTLKCQYDEYKFGLEVFDVHSFLEQTHKLTQQGKEYIRLPAFHSSHKRIIQDQIRSLTDIHNGIRTMYRSSMRRQNPLGVLVSGDSSVGKSSFTEILFQHFAKVSTHLGKPLTAEDNMRYSRNHNDDYWSGYRNQWFILLDDVASKLPSGRGDDDPSVNELLQLVNNVVFCPNQAHLEDKGKITMQSKLVVATTNTLSLNLQHSMNHPFASARRLPITLHIRPKTQYMGPNGELKVDFSEYACTTYDDYWEITVYDIHKLGDTSKGERQMVRYQEKHIFQSISKFSSWYGQRIQEHLQKEDSVTHRVESYENTGCCATCFGIINQCSCDNADESIEIQSGGYTYDFSVSMLLLANIVMLSYYFFSTLSQSSHWFHFVCRKTPKQIWSSPWEKFEWLRISSNFFWAITRHCLINVSARTYLMSTQVNMAMYKISFGLYLQRVRDLYTKYRTVVLISAAFVGFYGVYRLAKVLCNDNTNNPSEHRTDSFVDQSTSTSEDIISVQGSSVSLDVGKPPIVTHIERPDVWYRENVPLEEFEYSDQMISYKGRPPTKFRELVTRNLYFMKMYKQGESADGHAVAVSGNIFITNAHFFRDSEGNEPVEEVAVFKNTTLYSRFSYKGLNKYFLPNTDLVTFAVPSLPPHRSIIDYFPNCPLKDPVSGEILVKNAMGGTESISICGIAPKIQTFPNFNLENFLHLGGFPARDSRWTTDGDCGSLWWSQLEWGSVIHGIHVGLGRDEYNNPTKYVCVPISRLQLLEAISHFAMEFRVQGSFPILSSNSISPIALGPLHRKAAIRYVPESRVAVHGSFMSYVPKPRSRVGPTLIGEYLCEATKNHKVPIIDNSTAPAFTGWKPKRNNLLDMVNTHQELDPLIMAQCVEDYFMSVRSRLPKEEFQLLHVLDDHTAINGAPGVSYIDGIKRGTSAGYPWRGTKRKLLVPLKDDEVTFTDDVWKRINRIMRNYKMGLNARPVYVAHLKDEPTSLEKVAAHKTRVFCGAPLDFTFVVRKYLLTFVRVMQRNKFLFEAAPGTVVQSHEWDEIYNFLVHFGENRIVAGDYKRFDKCMNPVMIRHAFTIIRDICALGDYTKEDLVVIDCIATDTSFPLVDFFGDLMTFLGTNPSGHPLTVIINSIVNSLYMRFAWFSLKPKKFKGDFKDHVHLITYGDDNIMGVSQEASWFNHTAISDVLSASGVTYTMAEKDQVSVPFLNIFKTSFLKRRFRKHDTLPYMGCPILHDSISKRLTKCVKGKRHYPELHAVLVMASALDDYFFESRNLFDERRKLFIQTIDHFGLHPYSPFPALLPTWKELEERFLSYNEELDKLEDLKKNKKQINITNCSNEPKTNKNVVRPPVSGGIYVVGTESQNETLSPQSQSFTMATTNGNSQNASDTVPQAPYENHENVNDVQQTGGFVDSGPTPTVEFADLRDSTFSSDATSLDDLGDFLERPVEIGTWQWLEGTPFFYELSPWHAFFNNSVVKKKLDNYAFLQCKLHVKAVLNASPFYYGMGLVSYRPLLSFSDDSPDNPLVSNLSTLSYIPRSQRPHFFVLPQTNSAGEMELPFFYHKNWINITSSADLVDMGSLHVSEIVPLKNANGVTGDAVNVTFYAWATDVKLCGPTVSLSMQSGKYKGKDKGSQDEYSKSPVSSIASAVAGAAEKLIKVPVIGIYAKATSIGASAVSKIASLFGFTNVPVIENLMPMKNLQFHAMATGTISKPYDKLTIDAKNELCVDPRTVGLGSGDEMSLSYLCGKESLLATATWTSTDARATILFGSLVTPNLFDIGTVDYGKIVAATPMCQVSRNFQYWRGDIVFRIVMVCTQYHKGRVMVTWDPVANMSATTGDINTNYTRILDVDTNGSYEIRIPFLQSRHWMSTGGITKTSTKNHFVKGETPPYGASNVFTNGTITVSVLNELTSPVTTSDIYLVVFVRGCENLEFAYPVDIAGGDSPSSYFEPQSGKWSKMECESLDRSDVERPKNQSLVFHGEEYHSMRSILRRMNFETSVGIYDVYSASDQYSVYKLNFSKFPAHFGWDPTSSAVATNAALAYAPYCYNKVTPYHLIVPCFVGMRGTINRSYLLDESGVGAKHLNGIQVHDVAGAIPISGGRLLASERYGIPLLDGNFKRAGLLQRSACPATTGISLAHSSVQPSIEVAHPHFYPTRFVSTAPRHQMIGSIEDDTRYHFTQIELHTRPGTDMEYVSFEKFFGIGTDFTTFFFLNVPIQFFYNAVPQG